MLKEYPSKETSKRTGREEGRAERGEQLNLIKWRYADALGIAKLYGLDSDLVYQKQWAANPVSGDTLVS